MLDHEALLADVIKPICAAIWPDMPLATRLLLGTAAMEHGGRTPGGLGPFGVRAAQHEAIFRGYLTDPDHDRLLGAAVAYRLPAMDPVSQLAGNLYYGAACCLVVYRAAIDRKQGAKRDRGFSALVDAELGELWFAHYRALERSGSAAEFCGALARLL